ncbi:hypothetical protein [Nocardioides sp. GY 10127]|uniref:hypothetical protein n=1 Tax=Nocardioides sp. GY 10127 TaxID=2569762 RepID=UPI0010A7CFF2|nr:hypothetical protein [Nocardioides sp. GY 10127]TIC78769.1 hypothetical protein E8D37_18915 [Nocardioides sp. GY 10127]
MRAALIDETGYVANVIEIDDASTYTPPEGLTLLVTDEAIAPGWTQVDGVFTRPELPVIQAPDMPGLPGVIAVPGFQAQIDELADLILALTPQES